LVLKEGSVREYRSINEIEDDLLKEEKAE